MSYILLPTSVVHITSNAHVRFSKCRKNTNFYKKVHLFDTFLQKNMRFCAFFTTFLHQHAHLVAPKGRYQPKKANSKLKTQNSRLQKNMRI